MVADKYKSLNKQNRIVKIVIILKSKKEDTHTHKKCRPKAKNCHKLNLSVLKINTKIGFIRTWQMNAGRQQINGFTFFV